MTSVPKIEGADAVAAWFGGWPRFHDHYLLSAPESPSPSSEIRIHAWVTDWNAVDDSGYFRRGRDCVVALRLTGVEAVELSERTFPAIISDLIVTHDELGWMVSWESSYGAQGRIRARSIAAELIPGLELTRFGGRFRYAACLATECSNSNSIGLL